MPQKFTNPGASPLVPLTLSPAPGPAAQPVTVGVPLPRGTLREATLGRLLHADGTSLPVQCQTLCHWPDGSVKWLLADALLPANAPAGQWRLEPNHPPQIEHRLSIRETPTQIVIDTGATTFDIERRTLRPFEVLLTDRKGRRHAPDCITWQIEAAGPLRATLAAEGRFRRARGLRLTMRLSCFAGTGLLNLAVTLHNPHRARHRGGLWDLGDAGSVLFRDLSVSLAVPGDGAWELSYSLDREEKPQVAPGGQPWSLYQDSSGGENWNSRNHVNREERVACRFQGYRMRAGDRKTSGLRAEPTLNVRSSDGSLSLAFPEFWQQFPKAIEVGDDRLRIGLFPREHDDLHELQGGERKTHTMWLRFGDTDANARDLAWVHAPVVVRPEVEWCDATQSLPTLGLPNDETLSRLDGLLEESLSGPNGLLANRERVDEYGWRNYGDVFADHERAYYTGAEPLISHYNNQFDMLQGFLLHFLRTGDRRWWELGDALARHVTDIDLYHTREDKAAYNGGLFWFTDHYLHAHTSTHRTYSRHNRPSDADYGGGPGAQHNFTSGLLLHYCLTGNLHSRQAVLQLADWVIAMDDGRRTIFGVVDDGATGLASGSADYQGPDRAGGNSINALLDAWLLSGRRDHLEYAELLIRRCVHPEDDIAALDLLDVEKRWSYTVFLTSLAKYLDAKAEAGERDAMAAYTRSSLLCYAEWMLAHERPYFDQTGKLEFPTEAWAAQEFRKANVLRLAARHAGKPLRSSLLKRGTELANRAWQDLLRFETRTCARALAIVMVEGLKDCRFRAFGAAPAEPLDGRDGFPARRAFVPQRRRIRERLRRPAGFVGLAARGFNPLRWWRCRARRDGAMVNGTRD